MLSQYVEEAYALDLLSASTAEGLGYLLKDRVADSTRSPTPCAAWRRAARRSTPRSCVAARPPRREDPLVGSRRASARCSGSMAEGRSNDAIAEELVVSERAVEKHVTSIFSKLDLTPTVENHRRVLAVLAYLKASD